MTEKTEQPTEVAEKIAELSEYEGEGFVIYLENESLPPTTIEEVEEFLKRYQDVYDGFYDSLEEYAEKHLDDIGIFDSVSDTIRTYFDYGAYGRDLALGGDIWTEKGKKGLHIFRN